MRAGGRAACLHGGGLLSEDEKCALALAADSVDTAADLATGARALTFTHRTTSCSAFIRQSVQASYIAGRTDTRRAVYALPPVNASIDWPAPALSCRRGSRSAPSRGAMCGQTPARRCDIACVSSDALSRTVLLVSSHTRARRSQGDRRHLLHSRRRHRKALAAPAVMRRLIRLCLNP